MIAWAKPGVIPQESPSYILILVSNILLVTFLSVLATVSTIMSGDVIQGELALSDDAATWLTTLNLLGINTVVSLNMPNLRISSRLQFYLHGSHVFRLQMLWLEKHRHIFLPLLLK